MAAYVDQLQNIARRLPKDMEVAVSPDHPFLLAGPDLLVAAAGVLVAAFIPKASERRTPDNLLVKPRSGFGNVWCGLGDANAPIGWALDQEFGFGVGRGNVLAQDFVHGSIFQDSDSNNRHLAYVLDQAGHFARLAP